MEVLYSRCAGLDVHKESVTACILTPGEGANPHKPMGAICDSGPHDALRRVGNARGTTVSVQNGP